MNIKYLCKLTGMVFIVLGAAGSGWCTVRENRRLLFLSEKAVLMLKTIRHLVVYEKRTFAEACEHLAREREEPFADCFCRIAHRVRKHEGANFCLIWESEFRKETEAMRFTGEEKERLMKVPACMMASEPVRTAQMLDDTITFLEERVKGRKKQIQEREKVILSVCTMAGVLISILFW